MSNSENDGSSTSIPVLDRPATLEDVARLAGVSRQTVSNAVNAPHLLRAETLAKVSSAADRLDYRPNSAARAMRTGQAGVLAVRIGGDAGLERSHGVTAGEDFLAAFAEAARGRGRAVVSFTADDDAAEARRYTELVAGLGLDGVLVEHTGDPCAVADSDPRLVWVAGRRVRAVLVGSGDGRPGGPLPRVDVDLAAGFRAATTRLAELGHRRIALVGPGAYSAPSNKDKVEGSDDPSSEPGQHPGYAGWAAAMAAADLPVDDLAVPTGHDLAGVRSVVARVLARSARPTALLCTSELAAAVAHAEIGAWGLTVGEDVALVGVGDGLALQVLDVATLAVPAATLAGACVDLLLRRTPIDPDPDAPAAAPVVHLVPDLHARRSLDPGSDRPDL